MSRDGDQNLLFGILALQMEFITREQLIAAVSAWIKGKSRALSTVLVEQGDLEPAVHDLLQALVAKHLDQHGNDPQASLAALSSLGSVRQQLLSMGDDQVTETISMVPAGREVNDVATMPWTVGTATSAGQRFRVLRFHKRGGLGEVFVAYDQELNREVALKEIQRSHANNPESQSRFTLEAEITGGLEHPGIVPVYGLGHYGDGRPFYAMRFIRGENLKTAIEAFHQRAASRTAGENSLEFRQLLRRFLDVCRAIEYAHSRGVLHRDIKPGNIMLGKYGETLVVDWGLARASGRDEKHRGTPEETTLVPRSSGSGSEKTAIGQAMGTPGFMSPEQAEGRWDALGPATDVYGLGATLYVLLTGQTPFRGERSDVLRAVCRGESPPPCRVRKEVPRALDAVCRKAMALEPAQRYESAAELADDVERWLADEPVQAYREPWMQSARRWMRHHRLIVASVAALLATSFVALAIGYVLVSHQRNLAIEQRNIANEQRNIAREQRNLAIENAAMTRQVIQKFVVSIADDRWAQDPQSESLRIEMVDQAVRFYQQQLEEQPRDAAFRFEAALALRRSANLYRMVNRFDQAQPLYRESAVLMEGILRENPQDESFRRGWVELLCDQADAILRAEGSAVAEPFCLEARETASRTRQEFPASTAARLNEARAQLSHAVVLQQMGRYACAIPLAQAAAETFGSSSDSWPGDAVQGASAVIAWNNLAEMAREAGQLPLAAMAQKQAIERGRVNSLRAPTDPNIRFTLAAALIEQGRLSHTQGGRTDQAQASLEEAVEMLQSLAEQAPDTASYARRLADALTARAELHLEIGPLSTAAADAARAVEIAERLEQQTHGSAGYQTLLAFAYAVAGQVEMQMGNEAEARQTLAKAQQRFERARTANPDGPRLIEKQDEIRRLLQSTNRDE
jgi:serine/threonine-protein kinase